MNTKLEHRMDKRRGVAMGMVLMIGIVVLLLGISMIVTSGGLLQGTVDAKQRIRSRYAAEAMVELQMAKLDKLKDSLLGSQLNLPSASLGLGTPNGETGKVDPVKSGDANGQELITTSDFRGMKGHKVSFLVHATGMAPGGAKTNIDASLYLYQIPIFQFGVFYQGDLEIAPGPSMKVVGPVHTNGNAYFRASGGANLAFQGPVSVTGTLYHWIRVGGRMIYYINPGDSIGTLPQANLTLGPYPAVPGVSIPGPDPTTGLSNIQQHTDSLNLPIGSASPHELIEPCKGTESPSLKRQKFACMTNTFQFKNGLPSGLPWIVGDSVFYDRREMNWVHVWVVDVRTALDYLKNTNDSIIYLYDTVHRASHGPAPIPPAIPATSTIINAFRLIDADTLTRNVSIVSGNPIYLTGNFNTMGSSKCHPAETGVLLPSDPRSYCNAMIASDVFTLLSPDWSKWNKTNHADTGSLEQPYTTTGPSWATTLPPARGCGQTGAYSGTITINAAILTGNLPTNRINLRPVAADTTEGYFEGHYEGGWQNTIRSLENLYNATVVFNGSFVCMWAAQTSGLLTTPPVGSSRVLAPGDFYIPPTRIWGFDTRFTNIDNMPPGTPFLSTGVFSNWSERQ